MSPVSNFDKLKQIDCSLVQVEARSAVNFDVLVETVSQREAHETRTVQNPEELLACLEIILQRLEAEDPGLAASSIPTTTLKALRTHYSNQVVLKELVKIDYTGDFYKSRAYSITIRSLELNETLCMTHVVF